MIDLVKMSGLMESNKYRNVRISAEHLGIPFQIVGEGKAGLNKLIVLVKCIQELNDQEAARIAEEFVRMDDQSRSYLLGKVFLYCLIADRTNLEVASALLKRLHDNENRLSNTGKGGGGAMMIVDVSTGRIAQQKSIHPGLWVGKLNKVLAELLNRQAFGNEDASRA